MQNAKASALGALDEYPPAAGSCALKYRRGIAYIRSQLWYVLGAPDSPRGSPLLDTTGQGSSTSRPGGADGVLKPDLAPDITLLDYQGAWIHGEPLG